MNSKFAGLKEMRERRTQQQGQEASAQPAAPGGGEGPPIENSGSFEAAAPRRVGRPAGKRSNPEYRQVTVLLHSKTYTEARKRLLDEKKEVSELINELLDAWLEG